MCSARLIQWQNITLYNIVQPRKLFSKYIIDIQRMRKDSLKSFTNYGVYMQLDRGEKTKVIGKGVKKSHRMLLSPRSPVCTKIQKICYVR